MIRIRTKLLWFLIILVFLLNGVAFLLYQSNQHTIGQYNQLLNRFYLLNDISQKSTSVYQSLNTYLSEQTPESYQTYLNERKKLKKKQAQLPVMTSSHNGVTMENYRHMITSFLEESAIVSGAYQDENIHRYSTHLSEVENIEGYIHETTLTLLDGELTNYRGFYQEITQKASYFNKMGILVFVSTCLLCLLFAFWFSRGITEPVERLTAAADEVSEGRFDGDPIQIRTKDELRFLGSTFNDMRTNIQGLIAEIKEKSEQEQLLKEMELKNLQSQIHPHFLFNILNTVSRTAYLEGADRTSELVDSTAALLRYNLSDLDKPTTLEKEVEVIQEYFFLQQARFGERVRFYTDIDKATLSVLMPSMILQPLVENAFIHGIESYEQGAEIGVSTYVESDRVIAEVVDNGVGMDDMTRAHLLQPDTGDMEGVGEHHGHATGIGVRNVLKRLQLFYHIQDPVDIESAPGQGTKVTLKLPIGEGSL